MGRKFRKATDFVRTECGLCGDTIEKGVQFWRLDLPGAIYKQLCQNCMLAANRESGLAGEVQEVRKHLIAELLADEDATLAALVRDALDAGYRAGKERDEALAEIKAVRDSEGSKLRRKLSETTRQMESMRYDYNKTQAQLEAFIALAHAVEEK